ncbi:hypothetical protein [Phenylobacterium deserti]|nr:hypothetical protein [Phenylobacterium deserti]
MSEPVNPMGSPIGGDEYGGPMSRPDGAGLPPGTGGGLTPPGGGDNPDPMPGDGDFGQDVPGAVPGGA